MESFEAPLEVEGLRDPSSPFNGVFIRAPVSLELECSSLDIQYQSSRLSSIFQVILQLNPTPDDPPITVVARLAPGLLPPGLATLNASDEPRTFVALRQGLHFLTTFHPELTNDNRFHEYFVRECVLAGK